MARENNVGFDAMTILEANGAEAQAGAIDFAHLRRFTAGNPELEAEILQLFLAQTPKTIMELGRASDLAAWRMAAHTLKGSARAVGAWRLARAAEAAERLDSMVDAAMRATMLDEVDAAHQSIVMSICR